MIGSRLCIVLFVGSSRMTLFTMISSSLHAPTLAIELREPRSCYCTNLSLNHPFFPRSDPAVSVGLAGIKTNENNPMTNVNRPY